MSAFGHLTERMEMFRNELMHLQPSICIERAVNVTRASKQHEDKPPMVRRAYCLDRVLRNMSIFIEPHTLLVGNQAGENRAAPVFPEYALDWIIDELDRFGKRESAPLVVSEYNKRQLRELYPYWKGRTLRDKSYASFPDAARQLYDLGIVRLEDNITSGNAHIAVNYDILLRRGLCSVRRRAEVALQKLDLTDIEALKKSYFYEAIIIVVDAVHEFAERYAELAERLAAECENEARAAELRELARICHKVPMSPADTFHEALQSVWFVHLALQIESNGRALSYGRLDQYCWTYYERGRTAGMSREAAAELLSNLWLKTFSLNRICPWEHARFLNDCTLFQSVTIGGHLQDGSDALNELSELVLDTMVQVGLPQPSLVVRCHEGMAGEFMEHCMAALNETHTLPSFSNDEAIIPALINWGVGEEDAYNYIVLGNADVSVAGKWGYRCAGMSCINFPRALMIALNDGVDLESGKRLCTPCGHFLQMRSFDDVMHAWDVTIREITRQAVTLDLCADMVMEQDMPDILCSALTDDCLPRGKSVKQGGAIYDFISQIQVGISNLGDSLAAIKKCVYDDGSISRKQLWEALTNDFSGETGELVRRALLSAPKLGNNDDYADALLLRAYQSYMDEIACHCSARAGRGPIGGGYYAGAATAFGNSAQGASTGATPDGRYGGAPFAEGCNPAAARNWAGSPLESAAKPPEGDRSPVTAPRTP